jgi:uncharacterized protein with HEPN domain
MPKRTELDLIRDLLRCIEKIDAYKGTMSRDELLADEKTLDALIRNIEVR